MRVWRHLGELHWFYALISLFWRNPHLPFISPKFIFQQVVSRILRSSHSFWEALQSWQLSHILLPYVSREIRERSWRRLSTNWNIILMSDRNSVNSVRDGRQRNPRSRWFPGSVEWGGLEWMKDEGVIMKYLTFGTVACFFVRIWAGWLRLILFY